MTTQNSEMKAKADQFGENVFSLKTMRNYLSERAYKSLASTIVNGSALNPAIADEVADAMKTWALEKGATHFTHWFQPLTGITAEKHDSFFTPDREGGVLAQFSGKELTQGEPDASSFPSGGLRATFEARGYTAWDPTSAAFVRDFEGGSVLCIPTIFCGYYGDALDKKTPLLRSQRALCEQIARMAKLFGIACTTRACATLGPEQEYFLIDLDFFKERPDLIQCGRTLFGCRPARHQQLEDHYFGNIKPRVISFMAEVDRELWRLGVPAKTRHNEVAPAQFELAPVFEEQNLAVDHNMVTMMVLQEVAARHGLACLLHEKPFAGVNGSGKHNNWAVSGPDGKNWLVPGSTPHDNAKFLTIIAAIIKGVDSFAGLLRATVATAGNDHRLGANEAPPAIISIFLGEQLTDIFEQIEKGGAKSSKKAGVIELGVSTIPPLPRDATDRNRTSPMAFTGNKFEFRAVGSNQSCAGTNVALNTIMAWALDEICTELEAATTTGEDFNAALQKILRAIVKKHKRILFDGDGYCDAWKAEAAARGLPNLTFTPAALKELLKPDVVKLFETYQVLSKRELLSRYEIYSETYAKTIAMEAACSLRMARTMIAPAALEYSCMLADSPKGPAVSKLGKRVNTAINTLLSGCDKLESTVSGHDATKQIAAMKAVRAAADDLEGLVPESLWPLPGYGEMFFML